MDSSDFTHDQLEQLNDQLTRSCGYLRALQQRMQNLQLPYDDELRQRVNRAADALHGLWVCVHYLDCNRSAGRAPQHKAESVSTYRIQVEIDESRPPEPVEQMDLIEAETPLEALAKLARQGRLSPIDTFWARIVLEVDANGQPSKIVTVPLTKEITTPYRGAEVIRPPLKGKCPPAD